MVQVVDILSFECVDGELNLDTHTDTVVKWAAKVLGIDSSEVPKLILCQITGDKVQIVENTNDIQADNKLLAMNLFKLGQPSLPELPDAVGRQKTSIEMFQKIVDLIEDALNSLNYNGPFSRLPHQHKLALEFLACLTERCLLNRYIILGAENFLKNNSELDRMISNNRNQLSSTYDELKSTSRRLTYQLCKVRA